jgi:hypothetical protein
MYFIKSNESPNQQVLAYGGQVTSGAVGSSELDPVVARNFSGDLKTRPSEMLRFRRH